MYIFRQQRSFGIVNKLAMYEKRAIGDKKRKSLAEAGRVKKLNPFDKSLKDLSDLNKRKRYMDPYKYNIEEERLLRNSIEETNKRFPLDDYLKERFRH